MLLLSILFKTLAFSQSPTFKNFTVDDNLPSSECYQVLQDKKGFIWIATDKGVSRFNGYRFQNFTKKDGLPDNCILRMYEDQTGRIWYASISGKIAYYQDNKFKSLKINDELTSKISAGKISSICFNKNILWIGMYGCRSIFKVVFDSSFKRQKLTELNSKNEFQGIYIHEFDNNEYIQGCAIVYTLPGFNFKTKNKNIIKNNCFTTKNNPNVRSTVINNSEYLIYYSDEIIKVNKKTGQIKEKIPYDKFVNYLFTDSKNGLWLGTSSLGLLYYPKSNLKAKPKIYLKEKSISCIAEDKEGGIWISTLKNGIYYLKDQNFIHVNKFFDNQINCFEFLNNNLYAGLVNGNIIKSNDYETNLIENLSSSNNIDGIKKMLKINEQKIIFGGNVGFYEYYVPNKSIKLSYIKWPTSVINHPLTFGLLTFSKSKNNSFWIASYNFISKIHDPFNKASFSNFKILKHKPRAIAEYNDNIVYLGNLNGLFKFDGKSILFQGHNSIPLSNKINDIQIKKETIWNATEEYGICIKRCNKTFLIDKKNGLPTNLCLSIFLESENIGWVASNKGISKVEIISWSPFKVKIKNYNTENGLISNEVNQILKVKNRVYIASNGGITWFDENKITKNKIAPPIYVDSIVINDKIMKLKNKFILNYDQNNIDISYFGLTFKNIGNVDYKYRMIGLDTSWNYTKSTKVNYTTLPYGDYTFEVLAKNNDGIWSKNPTKIYFSITPPFWHTWFFRITVFLLITGGIYFFVKYRIKIVENRANEKAKLYQQTVEMEMKFLSSQMNPHFTFNAMNSIQYYLMDNEPEKAQKYLVKYSKLIRKVLENNMKKYVVLSDEIEMLSLYMDIESLRFEIQFDYEIAVSDKINEEEILIPPMIIQPYIENAIWHGLSNKKDGKGLIKLSFDVIDQKIKCTIEDNGVGRQKAKELKTQTTKKESLGMLITQQRLRKLHSESDLDIETVIEDLTDQFGNGIGTKISISLAYKYETI